MDDVWVRNPQSRLSGPQPPRTIIVTGKYPDESTTTTKPASEFSVPILNIISSDAVYNHFKDSVLQILQPLHNEHKIQIQLDQDNKLAREIQQIYCELKKVERYQAVTLAQMSGLLAAAAFGLGQCQRLTGSGQTLQLQQCRAVRVDVTAEETSCGWQPKLVWQQMKYTIGLDGFSHA